MVGLSHPSHLHSPHRKVDLQPREVLTSVFIPYTAKNEYVKEFKQVRQCRCSTSLRPY